MFLTVIIMVKYGYSMYFHKSKDPGVYDFALKALLTIYNDT